MATAPQRTIAAVIDCAAGRESGEEEIGDVGPDEANPQGEGSAHQQRVGVLKASPTRDPISWPPSTQALARRGLQ